MLTTGVELAHDLRMPLQLIYSCAQLLQLELGEAQQPAGEYVTMLISSVDHMRQMLDGALAGCGRELRATEPRPTPVNLPRCVRELCRRCRPYAENMGVGLSCSGNTASLDAALDEDMLSRILLNLISNALRHTPKGGRVRVTWRAMGDFVEISVSDSGAGISPERLPYIFLQGETEGGHGYGLPIARKLARAMGGDLTVRSVPGKGSAFTLRMPIRTACTG